MLLSRYTWDFIGIKGKTNILAISRNLNIFLAKRHVFQRALTKDVYLRGFLRTSVIFAILILLQDQTLPKVFLSSNDTSLYYFQAIRGFSCLIPH